MTDSSEIGRYGTLRLLKRHEPETTVAFFPIDDEEVTFGRSKQCSVRLYYDCVSELHCTLQISEQRKAFLLVQGTNGLLVDGCQVNPSTSASSPTTVPLTNGSEIEIYKKRFKFEYPPKEIRAALLATPRHGRPRRSLRMSMIRSAQVLTPRSSSTNMSRATRRGSIKDNAEWEVLRSPVRVLGHDNNTQEMMLLEGQGDNAVVVEEERDIIIIEPVDDQSETQQTAPGPLNQASNTGRSVTFSIPNATPPTKPVRVPRSVRGVKSTPTPLAVRHRSAPSLHRAVVLRSAQRAQLERERYEEQQEEDEVEAVVSPERDLGPFELSNGESDDENEEADQPVSPSNTVLESSERGSGVFKGSLDVVKKALPFNWKAPEEDPLPREEREDDEEGSGEEDEEEYEEDDSEFVATQTQTPVRRNLGPFMTPQVMVNRPAQRVPVDVKARASIGGEGMLRTTVGGARRVRTISPWKIQDIILSEPEKPRIEEKQEAKNRVTEEERQAILARRKSALQDPVPLPMPGPRSNGFAPPRRSDEYTPGENKNEDAETMVENMKQKIAQVRRKSEARRMRLSTSPQKVRDFSLLAAGASRVSRGFLDTDIMEETLSQAKRAELDSGNIADDSTAPYDNKDQDDLNMLDGSTDGELAEHTPARATSKYGPSLTPRFDGVREMFRQPRWQPKTPSFAGFKKMFQDRPEVPHKTPSFRGVKEMFRQPDPNSVLATPQLNLGEMFSKEEEDENDRFGSLSGDERGNVDSEGASDDSIMLQDNYSSEQVTETKTEDDDVPSPAPKGTRKPASTRGTSAKGKRHNVMAVSPAAAEDSMDEEDGDQESQPKRPTVTSRRTARRSAKKIVTPITDDANDSGNHPHPTRKGSATTTAAAGTSKATAGRKGRRGKKEAIEESEAEEAKPEHVLSGRGKRVTRNQQVSEDNEADAEVKGATSRKVKDVSSDAEGVSAPKARRGRAAKMPQVTTAEAPVAATTKVTRRGKTEDAHDNGDLPPVTKPKAKRGAKAKVIEVTDEDAPEVEAVDQSSEPEEAAPASNKGRGTRRGETAGSQDGLSDDKENTGDHPSKPTRKKPTTRGRKAPVTTMPVEALDAPAKRTRSRK